jgi:hypothetical protein
VAPGTNVASACAGAAAKTDKVAQQKVKVRRAENAMAVILVMSFLVWQGTGSLILKIEQLVLKSKGNIPVDRHRFTSRTTGPEHSHRRGKSSMAMRNIKCHKH